MMKDAKPKTEQARDVVPQVTGPSSTLRPSSWKSVSLPYYSVYLLSKADQHNNPICILQGLFSHCSDFCNASCCESFCPGFSGNIVVLPDAPDEWHASPAPVPWLSPSKNSGYETLCTSMHQYTPMHPMQAYAANISGAQGLFSIMPTNNCPQGPPLPCLTLTAAHSCHLTKTKKPRIMRMALDIQDGLAGPAARKPFSNGRQPSGPSQKLVAALNAGDRQSSAVFNI